MKSQRGFSMIEVVVTIAIFGILLAAAMPSIGDWLRNSRVRNTAESIQNGLSQARMEAVRRNRPVTFYLTTNLTSSCALSAAGGAWVISLSDPAGKCEQDASSTTAPQLVAKATANEGGGSVTVDAKQDASTAATSVTFNGFGQVAGNGIRQIRLSNGDFKRHVELSTGGTARMCDPDPAKTSSDPMACAQASFW